MFDEWQQAHVFVGQAIAHMNNAGGAQQPRRGERQRTPAQDLQRAGRSVGHAYQLFLRSGLTKQQAVDRITSLVQTFASLE